MESKSAVSVVATVLNEVADIDRLITSLMDDQGAKKLTAPMPGKIVRVLVDQGAKIEAGAGVLVVEAMKMQNEIKSPKKGKIQKILVSEGAAVNAGDVLAIVE